MADPICRWRNATPKTICEIVESLPKEEMNAEEFRKIMLESKWGVSFSKTIYQFACQTGLYYVDEKVYIIQDLGLTFLNLKQNHI